MKDAVHVALTQLINDFVGERAYKDMFLLSATSRGILIQMQSNLVNAQHIWGDIQQATDPAVRKLSINICIKNLETFVEATAAARELYLILPNHLVDYQDRAGTLIQQLKDSLQN